MSANLSRRYAKTYLAVLAHFVLAGGIVAEISTPVSAQMEVTFTGNNGVMLSAGGKKVLIDSLQNHTNSMWTRLSQVDLQKMIAGTAPFDDVGYALATHNHPDHYSRTPVLNFLANNPDATIFTSALDSITLLPIPEPSTGILCCTVFAMIVVKRRNRL